MRDYKKMLHWIVRKQPSFDFELEQPLMFVWLHGENHVIEGYNTEELIEKGMQLEEYLDYKEQLDDEEREKEQRQVKADESGLLALSECYCDILSITCSHCKSRK